MWLISANRDNVERVRAIEKAGNQGKRQVVSRGVERQWQASEQPSEKEKPSFVLVADFCDSFPIIMTRPWRLIIHQLPVGSEAAEAE